MSSFTDIDQPTELFGAKPSLQNPTTTDSSTRKCGVEELQEKLGDPTGSDLGDYGPIESFDDMGLPPDVLRGVYSSGYEDPSVIQQLAIRPAADGKDLLIQAQSGTGKTATFTIGALAQLDTSLRQPQILVLSPTRELAIQSTKVARTIGLHLEVSATTLIGGHSVRECVQELRNGTHVVSGTPGRVFHMMHEGYLDSHLIQTLVLDEADVMLDFGFQEQVFDIFQMLPRGVQVLLVSATMSKDLFQVAEKILRNPVKILVKPEKVTLDGIHQYYVDCGFDRGSKFEVLCDLYSSIAMAQSIIFVNTRREAERLSYDMDRRDFTCSVIHGDMTMQERESTFNVFVQGGSRVLIATDILARGIDVQQVSVVVNYDLPNNRENYVHRIGRGGRFGRKAVAINLVTEQDVRQLRDIQSYWACQIDPLPKDLSKLM